MGLKVKLLKRVNNYVRIIKDDKDYYVVQSRVRLGPFSGMSEWKTLNMFPTYSKAANLKNMHIVMVIMRELGHRHELVRRRTKRKREKGLI